MQSNNAVRGAAYDFWHNRMITTSAGQLGVQDAFLTQSDATMSYLRQQLRAESFQNIIGLTRSTSRSTAAWTASPAPTGSAPYLMPFYQRFRAVMDDRRLDRQAGLRRAAGLLEHRPLRAGRPACRRALGSRYVFNSHFYDGARMTLDPSTPRTAPTPRR